MLLNRGVSARSGYGGSRCDSVWWLQLCCVLASPRLGAGSQDPISFSGRRATAGSASRPRRGGVSEDAVSAQVQRICGARASALEYLRADKRIERRAIHAPNAVDNDLFAAAACRRSPECAQRRCARLDLPRRYFLFVGRLVREKGVFELLSAYAKLDDSMRQQVGLVFRGRRSSLDSSWRSRQPRSRRERYDSRAFAQREQLSDLLRACRDADSAHVYRHLGIGCE